MSKPAVFLLGLLSGTSVFAQDAGDPARLVTKVVPTPLFQAQSEFALPTTGLDAGEDRFGLGFTVTPDGSISNVRLTALSGNSRSGYCEPICWEEGEPPSTFCMTMAGCPGTGGGGGGGVLSVTGSPLILEFTSRDGDDGELVFDFDVEEISPGRPTFAGELSVTLPGPVPIE